MPEKNKWNSVPQVSREETKKRGRGVAHLGPPGSKNERAAVRSQQGGTLRTVDDIFPKTTMNGSLLRVHEPLQDHPHELSAGNAILSNILETLEDIWDLMASDKAKEKKKHRSRANGSYSHDIGSRDPAKLAKTLLDSGKANAIHLLALRASSSSSGYIVSSNNAEFFMPIARELVNARSNLLVNFGDEAINARFKESVVQHLTGKYLPQIFVSDIRRPVIHKFKELVPCDEQGHHDHYNQANFQNVSLQSPRDAEYRVENGDPYGQVSYLRLLEEMSRSFYPTERMRTVHATRAPADSMTPNMLAFVEFLMVQTILGERRNLGRAMTSRRNADLYTTLRADTLSRNSVHVTVLDVKQLENDLKA